VTATRSILSGTKERSSGAIEWRLMDATKHDLEHLESLLQLEMEALEHRVIATIRGEQVLAALKSRGGQFF
jgi:hypothetical protein